MSGFSGQANVLVIMADQMTPFMLGACGGPVPTPHISALAERGVQFTTAYTPSPICVPARSCYMTGLLTSTTGCYDNGDPFPSYVPTYAHYLSAAGWDTVLSGKMHFIGPDQLHGLTRRLNADIYPSGFLWSYPLLPDNDPDAMAFDFAPQYQAQNIGAGWTAELQYDEETHFRALEYLRHAPKGRPFHLTVSYTNPHPPYIAPRAYWERWKDADLPLPDWPEDLDARYSDFDRAFLRWYGLDRKDIRDPRHLIAMRRGFAALANFVDDKVGALLDVLDETGLLAKTIVVFTADHGEMLGEHGLIQKRSFYDWSARIPLIVAGPGIAARAVETPVSLIDLPPTFLDLAGCLPVRPMEGRSLAAALAGGDLDDVPVISEYHGEGIMRPCFMVRKGRWKYHYTHGAPGRLYDMMADPDEWQDLAGRAEVRETETELRDLLTGGRFDLDRIGRDVWDGLPQKAVVNAAMDANGTAWDYRPDPTQGTAWVRA
jgi:choline-sulfatase